jgi:protein phosphatase
VADHAGVEGDFEPGATGPAGPSLIIPARGVVLLIGASGAGKSTFARGHFASTEVLSSDAFRALVGDDEGDQSATPAAFDVLERVLAHRLRRGLLSVVDATNAKAADRRSLLGLAAAARRPAVAIVLDLPEALCLQRNRLRDGRNVAEQVIGRQIESVRRTLADPDRLLAEGLAAVHVLASPEAVDQARVIREVSLAAAPRLRPPVGDANVRSALRPAGRRGRRA